jgi:adenylosuccinate synthase
VVLKEKNAFLAKVYNRLALSPDQIARRYLDELAPRIEPMIVDCVALVHEALEAGQHVLLEGAQATFLDLDHGTYPFVTSSSTVAGGAAPGIGIGPTRIDEVIGVAKAYVTRVGEGPFPTEIAGTDQQRLQELGAEFGTVTGRTRRCGWLDLVALRYAVRVNGMTSLALTKLDVLSAFAELPVCVRYRLRDGTETDDFPAFQSDFHHCEPVYEVLAGWNRPLDAVNEIRDLPAEAGRYLDFVQERLEVEVSLVGTGRERERVLERRAEALAG